MPAWGPSSALTALLLPQLILVASDLGQPVPYETMQPLQVALEDIDDNEPLFVRPPVSLPLPCTGHTTHCPHCAVDTRGYTRKLPGTSQNKYCLNSYYVMALPSSQNADRNA